MVVSALYYQVAREAVSSYQDQLAGKILVDISNHVNQTFDDLAIPPGTSAAEELAKIVPAARVVKAFNTTFAGLLAQGHVGGAPLDVFIAGDDDQAKVTVAQLIVDGGQRVFDVGPLRRSRQLTVLHGACRALTATRTLTRNEVAMPDEFMPQGIPLPAPTAVVIFGASGDLTQRKLIPALYTLFAEQHLPEQFAVIGDASLFARADEIERSWQITDPIQAGWNQEVAPANGWRAEIAPPLEFYEQGTWGPPAADRLLAQAGRHWRLGCSNKHR